MLKVIINHLLKKVIFYIEIILILFFVFLKDQVVSMILKVFQYDINSWVLISLIEFLLIVGLGFAWLILNRSKNKEIIKILNDNPMPKYGIYWDKYKNPLCNKCLKPLGLSDNPTLFIPMVSGKGGIVISDNKVHNSRYTCSICGHENILAQAGGGEISYDTIKNKL